MTLSQTWRFGSNDQSWLNRVYDGLRFRVNRNLVHSLSSHIQTKGSVGSEDDCSFIRILEAGSGAASATSLFRRESAADSCVCLDRDEEALRSAKVRDPGIPAVVGDMQKMPFRDGAFQLIFSNSTVEHLDEPDRAVWEMSRVCRNGGRVFVGVPYRFGPLGFQPLIGRTSLGVWLGPVFSASKLDAMMRRARLQPISCWRYFLWFFIGIVARRGTGSMRECNR